MTVPRTEPGPCDDALGAEIVPPALSLAEVCDNPARREASGLAVVLSHPAASPITASTERALNRREIVPYERLGEPGPAAIVSSPVLQVLMQDIASSSLMVGLVSGIPGASSFSGRDRG
jgi:hypothetical protein